MPVPPARVPLSDTSIAHEVFGYLWGLIFLGAVRGDIPVPIPFDPALTRFVGDNSEAIDRIKALIRQALGLSPDAMAIFDDTRRNLPGSAQTGDSVAGWLMLYSRNRAPLDLDLGDSALVRRAAQLGVKRQLYGFAEAMTLAFAARPPSDPSQVSSVHRAATEGAALAGEPDPAAAARRGYEAWCVAGLTGYLDPNSDATEEARSRLREVVDQLDAAFGIGEDA
jgi:hypothetical protein